jgi:hypothetical protein
MSNTYHFARRRDEDDDDDRRPAKRNKGQPVVLALVLGGVFVLCCGGVGVIALINKKHHDQAQQEIQEADLLYSQGRQEEAVAKYKSNYHLADNKADLLRRIVEWELHKGNTNGANEWVKKGFDDGVAVTYDSAAAKAILAKVQKEHDEKVAKAKKAKEAKENAGDYSDASEIAEKAVKRKLKFPEEARITTDKYLLGDDGVWVFQGTVIAKNAFGVKSKYKWTAAIKRERDAAEPNTFEWKEVACSLVEDVD